ncbi:MAG: GNAT family N-acetyltransferase [Spirochaetota bacterium]
MNIRDYRPTDLPYLYDICLRTGDSGKDASSLFSDPYMLGQYFAAPYAVHDARCVLVLEESSNDTSKPVGYILGTSDTVVFNNWFDQVWRPGAQVLYGQVDRGSRSDLEARVRLLFSRSFPPAADLPSWYDDYPGHIHIDLLPEAQGAGWGRRLMDASCVRLKSLACPGFHLGVGKQNEGGVAFYRRYGMEELESLDWGYYFGKRL